MESVDLGCTEDHLEDSLVGVGHVVSVLCRDLRRIMLRHFGQPLVREGLASSVVHVQWTILIIGWFALLAGNDLSGMRKGSSDSGVIAFRLCRGITATAWLVTSGISC